MKALRGSAPAFEKDRYDFEAAAPYEEEIRAILEKRQMDACDDWKAFGEKLSGQTVPDFDLQQYQKEYLDAAGGEERDLPGEVLPGRPGPEEHGDQPDFPLGQSAGGLLGRAGQQGL